MEDRFKDISRDYGELFIEVFEEEGLNYLELERSAFLAIKNIYGDSRRDLSLLDIGIGDGETVSPFLENDWENVTGIDLNSEMIEKSKEKFGNKIRLIQMDATDMGDFREGSFDIITTGMCIHNISKNKRKLFWNEIKRLRPEVFVAVEKVADENPEKHKRMYDDEVAAIKKVYGEKHGLKEAEASWVKHYEDDEAEKLTMDEVESALSDDYDIENVFEMGMYKTLVLKKK